MKVIMNSGQLDMKNHGIFSNVSDRTLPSYRRAGHIFLVECLLKVHNILLNLDKRKNSAMSCTTETNIISSWLVMLFA